MRILPLTSRRSTALLLAFSSSSSRRVLLSSSSSSHSLAVALTHPIPLLLFINHKNNSSSSSNNSSSSSNNSNIIRRNISNMSMSQSQTFSDTFNCPTIPMYDGTPHPVIGFGTYKVGFIPASASSATSAAAGGSGGSGGSDTTSSNAVERTAEECVSDALSTGYRFLECAEFYGNESEVGKAIAKSGINRSELFLCSKVWTTTIENGPEAIRQQLDKTLNDLGTDYLDLYLIHWPVPGKHVEAYKTLETLQKEGKIRNIGLSNYSVEDYIELKDSGIQIKPAVNQIEINPFLYRKNTLDFFTNEGIILQSYRSLRDGKKFDDPTLVKIASAKGKSTAQILGRWCVQKGFIYLPKSVKKHRMIENANVFDFELTGEEMEELDNLTEPEAFDTFFELYKKCVLRDTSKDGSLEGVKMNITKD